MPSSGLDPKLAARLNELGPITISRPENIVPRKVPLHVAALIQADDMMTILQNRANMAQILEDERGRKEGMNYVSMVIVKEIMKAQRRKWTPERIGKEYNLDPSVLQRLGTSFSVPVINKDGIVLLPGNLSNEGCLARQITCIPVLCDTRQNGPSIGLLNP
jgi:hypothetical protein